MAMKIFRRKNNKNEFLELLPQAIASLTKILLNPSLEKTMMTSMQMKGLR